MLSVSGLQGSEQESKGLPCKKGIVQSIVGQGYHRKVILASQATQNSMYRSVAHAPHPLRLAVNKQRRPHRFASTRPQQWI